MKDDEQQSQRLSDLVATVDYGNTVHERPGKPSMKPTKYTWEYTEYNRQQNSEGNNVGY
ncbi:hypothetical protein [Actinomyces qiguomingii]|uniref:hypothetical protein n=1 Tax=Actinomyces qiguomingii TaxID=2057800 RepID=UPI0013048A9D|nr:hypothetical protein [Actinomyces qiguomingii]